MQKEDDELWFFNRSNNMNNAYLKGMKGHDRQNLPRESINCQRKEYM